jgi:2-polyprenyl-3-methyl-5-hydroxy-6-metoxy-1,4-benzoquinol methylase
MATIPADQQRDQLVERIFGDCIAFMEIVAVYLGDRLGYYRALGDGEFVTAGELAKRTGTDPRYTREWLEQQAVSSVLDVDDTGEAETRRFRLPEGHREALCEETSLAFITPFAQTMLGVVRPIDALAEAFRTGKGVPYPDYGEDIRAGIERGNRPMFLNLLTSEWIPAMPDIDERLRSETPARIADFGCGSGWSSIALAQGYPNAFVDGLDIDEESIAQARKNAEGLGLDDRLTFLLQDAGDASLSGKYDFACAFECIHDMSDPVAALRSMRNLVGPGGTVLIGDERVADTFTAPGDEIERLMYGFSVTHCLAVGMVDKPSAATGTVMRASTLEEYAREAGFQLTEVLPIENALWRFYRLTA